MLLCRRRIQYNYIGNVILYNYIIQRNRSSPEEIEQTTVAINQDRLSLSIHGFRTKCLRFIFHDPTHTLLYTTAESNTLAHCCANAGRLRMCAPAPCRTPIDSTSSSIMNNN